MRFRRTASFVLAGALALGAALAVSALPAGAATAINYVALGDSYSSGDGAGNYSGGACLRSAGAYPELWAKAHFPASFTAVTCAGATTDNVLHQQLGALKPDTTLVTITIGGNDAGFANVMATCSLGGDQKCLDAVNQSLAKKSAIADKLAATYAAIKQHAPKAEVIVLGYPHIFASGQVRCSMDQTKRDALNRGADVLNGVIADQAQAAGFTYQDVRGTFDGHGVCSSDPWIHGLDLAFLLESFHPTKTGQAKGYYAALAGVTG
jgi:lysophospholipase L1-like esterase